MPILEVDQVHTYYGNIQALKGISLTVEKGEIVTLIGSNGAGKTTTLRTIAGVLRPRKGTVRMGDRDLTKVPTNEIVKLGLSLGVDYALTLSCYDPTPDGLEIGRAHV